MIIASPMEKGGEMRPGFGLDQTENEAWRAEALCRDGSGMLVDLFFSEHLDDIARAQQFCRSCDVREECLEAALDRREPWGVWGGEYFINGKPGVKKRPGRQPKTSI